MTEDEYLRLPFDSIMTVPASMCPSGLSHVVFRPTILTKEGGDRLFTYVNDDNRSASKPIALLAECGVKSLGARPKIIPMVVAWPDGRETRVSGKTGYVCSRWDEKAQAAVSSVEIEGEYLEDSLTFDGATSVKEDFASERQSPQ
jgi:hypothetical protein